MSMLGDYPRHGGYSVTLGDVSAILHGIRVVELTSNIAAPFAGEVLAQFGADVTHIEPPQGDDSRRMSPVIGEESAYFRVVNAGKDCVSHDLRDPEEVQQVHDLLAHADVFVTNMRPHRLVELALDAEALTSQFPRLITGYLTAYGDHTSEANQSGYDGVVQARTGIVSVTGESEPARAGVSILDIGSGTWLALGIVAALYDREKTGRGSSIATSLMETGVHWSAYHLAAYQVTHEASRRHGTGHPAFAPYGIYPTANGEILIGVGGDAVFARLTQALSMEWMLIDPRFATNAARVANNIALSEELTQALASLTQESAMEKLRAHDVPADLVQQPEDLLRDPSAQEQLGEHDFRIPALPLRINQRYPGR